MLTRIRNASLVNKYEVVIPMSKIKYEIAKILKREGFVLDTEILKAPSLKKRGVFDEIKILLKYKKSGKSVITKIGRISKPGLRVYSDKHNLPKVLNNIGIAIISTPEGLMTNKEARKKNLGGEIICEIY
jgi:small subunit ribosomal protein S8